MNRFKTKIVGLTIAALMSAGSLIPMVSSAVTIDELLAQIAALQAQLLTLQGSSATVSADKCAFTRSLTVGSRGDDVTCLQNYLKGAGHLSVSATGYFGSLTKAAAASWQSANGVAPAVGYFGSISRAKYDSLMATTAAASSASSVASSAASSVSSVAATGEGLTITAATQPAATLAVKSAARLPFTKVTLTAGAQDVTVTGITVERTGLANDAAFAGVVLLDEAGIQLGVAKTFNSEHKATVGDTVTIKAGTSKTFTIAGNMASNQENYAGQVAYLSVTGVTTSATVSGLLPISGAGHTINNSLSIGTVTPSRGALDPNATATKEIGTTGYTFSSVKVEAGSVEKIRIKSIRWNQSGSAGAADLANIKTYVDGTAYDVVASSDGKYFTSTFGDGIVVDKGLSKEISIKADIISGSGRNVAFDLYRNTDLNVSGETYGYGITPASTGTGFATTNPWYDASVATVSAGTVSSISQSNTVPAQNIAVLSANQPMGGFEVKVRGEAITVQQMIFNIQANGDEAENITNIRLVDQNGNVVAGPVNGASTATDSANGTVTFTDTVTFPVGTTILQLQGRLGSAFVTNDTVQASTTPSSQWTTVKGVNTGETVSLSSFSSAIQSNLMTVKAGALAISVSTQPTARNVIAGSKGFEFARYVLDAGQSGEDVRLTNFKASTTLATITASQLSNCNLHDGTNNVTDGTNVTLAAGDNTFTFDDGGLVVTKGTSKTLSMKCDLAASATSGTVRWGLTDNSGTYTSATTVVSGQTVTETMTYANGQTMTAASTGSYTVTNDSAVIYKIAQAGTTGVTLAKLRFTAGATENVNLKQIALELGNTSASSTPADLVNTQVTLWNSAGVQIGTAQFGGANPRNATSTILSPAPSIAAGESVLITVKGDLSAQNVNDGTPGAFLSITYDGNNNGINGNYATGADSQSTISGGTTSDVTTDGLRIFRTVPTIAVTSNGGTLSAGADLYKFTVTNSNSRDVVLQKFSMSVATSGGATNGFILYGDGIAFNNSTSTVGTETVIELISTGTSNAQIVPANSSKTYILKATTAVDTASVSESINLALLADTSYPAIANLMGTVTTVEAGSANTDNIIWSPFSTTTPVATEATQNNLDWTNGYGMPGFPSNTAFPVQVWTRSN